MMYEKAMAKIANIEFGLDELDGLALAQKKFNYVISAQIYQRQKDRGDSKAEDIEFIMRKFPSLRVAFLDECDKNCASVLIGMDQETGICGNTFASAIPDVL